MKIVCDECDLEHEIDESKSVYETKCPNSDGFIRTSQLVSKPCISCNKIIRTGRDSAIACSVECLNKFINRN